MKEQLTLEHLAPYLPYGLKGVSIKENLGIETVKGFSIYGRDNTVCLSTNVDDIDLVLFKPILIPLSDLTKEIEVNGEKFVPMDKIKLLCNDESFSVNQKAEVVMYLDGSWERPNNWTYELMVLLFQWHFDIFNLIPQNLAIDINTLK